MSTLQLFAIISSVFQAHGTSSTYTTTADIPLPLDPGSYWDAQAIEIANEDNFHAETCDSSQTLPRATLGILAWWNPYSNGDGFYPIGVAFTYAMIDENTMQIIQQSPLSQLAYKPYSYYATYSQPWMNVQISYDSRVNGYIAYMINLADTKKWRKIGTYLYPSGQQTLQTGVSVIVNHAGAQQISFHVTGKTFQDNGGVIFDATNAIACNELATNIPSFHPTNLPTSQPTELPTFNPSINPTNNPTINPTSQPTSDPTNIPTTIPTAQPTTHPTVNPTTVPTKDPTYDPTNDPTTDPTINPTHAPTYCFNAKYQHEMFGLQKDHLWSDEALVSSNCKYIIKMYKNGNLILHGYTGNRHKAIADLWMTNTTVYNRSGNSVPQFIIENGQVKVIEYQYVNVPGVPVIELWTSSNITIQNKNNIIFTLTDDGCLVLIDANDEYKNNYIWKQCIKTTTDIPITNTFIITGYDDDDTQNITGNQSQNAGTLWWVWLLIILIIFIGFFVWFLIRKYYCIDNSTESQVRSTVKVTSEDVQNIHNTKENDTCSYETDQIDKWINETEMGNIHGEGERNYHTSIFNTEIMFNNTNNVADTEQV